MESYHIQKVVFDTEEHQEAGGDGDGDQAEVLHQLELDSLLLHARAGHRQTGPDVNTDVANDVTVKMMCDLLEFLLVTRSRLAPDPSSSVSDLLRLVIRLLNTLTVFPDPEPGDTGGLPILVCVSYLKLLFRLTLL